MLKGERELQRHGEVPDVRGLAGVVEEKGSWYRAGGCRKEEHGLQLYQEELRDPGLD